MVTTGAKGGGVPSLFFPPAPIYLGPPGGPPRGTAPHGDRHGGHEIGQYPHVAEERAKQKKEGRNAHNAPRNDLAEPFERPLQGRFDDFRVRDEPRYPADLRPHARFHHDRRRIAPHGVRRGIEHVFPVAQGGLSGNDPRTLLHFRRFARQRRLVAFQVFGGKDAAVGGNAVPLLEADDVPGHEQSAVQQYLFPVAAGLDAADGEALHLFDGVVGAVLLHETDDVVQKDDDEQDDGIHEVVAVAREEGKDGGNARRDHQKNGHEIAELRKKEE